MWKRPFVCLSVLSLTFDLDFWSGVDPDPGQDGILKVKVVSLVDEPFYI